MVQFFQAPTPRKTLLNEQIGMNLGKGLSDFMGSYFANKSLEKVLGDETYEKAPASEKMSRLQAALTPYGDYGRELLQHRIQGLQQQEVEKEQEKRARGQAALGKMIAGEQVTPEEMAMINPEHLLKLVQFRNRPAPGGVTAQPIPPEVSSRIQPILEANKNAKADDLAVAFDNAGIPRVFSNSYIENRRREDEAKTKREAKESDLSRQEKITFHKESQKMDETISKEAKAAESKIKAMEKQEALLPKLKTWDRIASAMFKGSPWENIFTSANAQEFNSYALPMVEGQKETFGVRLSDADLRLVTQKIATTDKSAEANKKIIEWMKEDEKLKIERQKIAQQIKKENGGYRPHDYEEQIRKKMDEKYGDHVKKLYDEIMALPDDPKKKQELTGRTQVPQGTKLDQQKALYYLQLADMKKEEAERMAREDGYEF